jgi:hypothetical protein
MATTVPALRASVHTGEHRTSVSVDESGNTNIQELSH